eukprot:3710579-Amphidinium_carterae.1
MIVTRFNNLEGPSCTKKVTEFLLVLSWKWHQDMTLHGLLSNFKRSCYIVEVCPYRLVPRRSCTSTLAAAAKQHYVGQEGGKATK